MISFVLHDIKPCSINAGYYKTKKVLTLEGRRYRKRLLVTLNQNAEIKKQLNILKEAFDPALHGLKVTYYFFIPPKKMYLKGTGPISMASGDTDNYFKLTTDFLFSPKYLGHTFPGESNYIAPIENIGIDDRFILKSSGYKLPNPHGDFYSVGIKADIVSKTPSSYPSFKCEESYKPKK